MNTIRTATALALAASMLACQGNDTTLPPAPVLDAGPDAPDAGETPDAGPAVIRTVETRSPFGDLSVTDNLVLDGDFEFTGRTGQAPWMVFDRNGQAVLGFATGGLCRSGVRCAKLAKGAEMVGWLASPKAGGMNVSAWVKPAAGECYDVQVAVADLNTQGEGELVPADGPRADASGWCHYQGDVGNYAGRQPVVYVGPAGEQVQGPILADDIVARALPPTLNVRVAALASRKLDDATRARVGAIGDWIRTHRIYGRAPHDGSP